MSLRSSTISNNNAWLRWILFIGLGCVVVILTLNSLNSGLVKLPLLALTGSLLLAEYVRLSIQRQYIEVSRSKADVAVLVFLTVGIISAIFSPFPHHAMQALLLLSSGVVVFFATTQLATTRKDLTGFLSYVSTLAGIVSVLGLFQYFLADRLPLEFFMGADRRIGSTLGSPAFLGGFVVLLLPVTLSRALPGGAKGRERMLMTALAGLLMLTLFLTMSRTSIIAGILSVGMLLALRFDLRSKTLARGATGIGVVCILAFFLIPHLGDRFVSMFDRDASSTLSRRYYFWEAGYKASLDSPLFGHGIGSYEPVMMRFRSPDYWLYKSEDLVPHAHNEFLQVTAETGVIGLILYCSILVVVVREGWRTYKKGKEWERINAAALLCGIAAILIDNLGNVSLRQAPVGAMAWMFMGLLVSRGSGGNDLPVRRVALRVPRTFMAVPIWGWVTFAAFFGDARLKEIRSDGDTLKGILAGSKGESAQAIRQYKQATELNPFAYLAHSNLALEYLRSNQPDSALTAINALETIYPGYPKTALMRSVALLTLERPVEALPVIRVELERRNHPEAYLVESRIHRSIGDSTAERSAIINMLEASLRMGVPYNTEYGTMRLRLLSTGRDQLERTRELYEALLARFTDDRFLISNLSLVYLAAGDTTRATALRNRVNSLFPTARH